jgi:hypothetical protein
MPRVLELCKQEEKAELAKAKCKIDQKDNRDQSCYSPDQRRLINNPETRCTLQQQLYFCLL